MQWVGPPLRYGEQQKGPEEVAGQVKSVRFKEQQAVIGVLRRGPMWGAEEQRLGFRGEHVIGKQREQGTWPRFSGLVSVPSVFWIGVFKRLFVAMRTDPGELREILQLYNKSGGWALIYIFKTQGQDSGEEGKGIQ